MIKRRLQTILILFALSTAYALGHQAVFSSFSLSREQLARAGARTWPVPTLALEVLAGEFKGLFADLMVMEIGAQLGAEVHQEGGGYVAIEKQYDWNAISRLFNHAITLDPHFQQTYMLAQGWLPWEANRVGEANRILAIARENRPWDWRPAHFIGFNTYYFLKQPGKAGRIFLKAAKTPNAPPFLAILGARLAQKGGETRAAIALMQSMLAGKDPGEPGYQDIIDRLKALRGVRVIELAAARYQKKYNAAPPNLNSLTKTGILKTLPPNPYDLPYCMDRTGAIYFDRPDCNSPKPD